MEKLSFLRQHVPTRTSKRISKINANIDELSRTILINHRSTTIFFASKVKFTAKGFRTCQSQMLHSSEAPKDSFSMFGVSLLQVQTFSFLLEFLHGNLCEFANNILFISKMPAFSYLAAVGFPALFGFFSNEDLCESAANFYIQASNVLVTEVFSELVAPFFSTDIVFNFSKIVFNDFFWENYIKQAPLETLALKLFTVSEKSLKFLPETHLKLIRCILRKWGKDETWMILVQTLIIPQFRLNCLTSPYARAQAEFVDFEKLAHEIEKCAKEGNTCNISMKSISHSVAAGIPTPPHEGEPFSQTTILTLFDIRALLSLPIIFPAHLQCINELDVSAEVGQFVPFFVKFFIDRIVPIPEFPLFFAPKEAESVINDPELGRKWTKIRSELSDPVGFLLSSNDNMIYPNARTRLAFSGERGKDLINFGIEKEIERYEKASFYFEKLLTYGIIIDSLSVCEENSASYISAIAKAATYNFRMHGKGEVLNIIETNFWNALILLSEHEQQYIEPFIQQLVGQENVFKELLDTLKLKFTSGLGTFSSSATLYMWKLSGLLNVVNESSSLFDRYTVISTFMERADELSMGISNLESRLDRVALVLHFFVVIYDARWMYRTAVLLQKYIFGSQNAAFCPFALSEQWSHFFTAFLNLISFNEKLLADFTQISVSS